MAETSIEWTDTTWNPVAGCTVLSPGCTNCYAIAHTPDISRAVDVLEPVGRHIGRGEHWIRDRIHNATR